MTRLPHRLALSTAIASQLFAAPLSAETDPLIVNRTHPSHLTWAAKDDGRPMDLRPTSETRNGRGDPAAADGEILRPAGLLGLTMPTRRRRKNRVEFEPRFDISVPSRSSPGRGAQSRTTAQVNEDRFGSGRNPFDAMQPRRAPERAGGRETARADGKAPNIRATSPVPIPIPAPPRPGAGPDTRPDAARSSPPVPEPAPSAVVAAAPRRRDVPRPHPLRPAPRPVATLAAATALADETAIAGTSVGDEGLPPAPETAPPDVAGERGHTGEPEIGVASSAGTTPDATVADGESITPDEATDESAADDSATRVASVAGVGDNDAPARADGAAPAAEPADQAPLEGEAPEDTSTDVAAADADETTSGSTAQDESEEQDDGEEPPARVDNTPIPSGPRPFQLVRMMTALQDDIARGSSTALQAQRVLSRRIGERFRASAPREWADPENGRALVTYALSGGDPSVVRDVLADAWLEGEYMALAKGALAFVEGREEDAKHHFESVAGSDIAYSVLGSVRLAQAALAVGQDRDQAMAFLADAQLTAPGTLVEEAALRRAVLLAAEENDLPAFKQMVSRYLRKFRSSVYAGNFRRRLAAALTRMSFIDDPGAIDQLEPTFEPMTATGRQELYLMIASAAIENGSHQATQAAAARVLETADAGTLDHTRAQLYRAAAEIVVSDRLEEATAVLNRLQSADLPDDDRGLLEAALRLSQSMVTLPAPALDIPAAAETPMMASHEDTGGALQSAAKADRAGGVEADPDTNERQDDELAEDDPLGPPLEVERRVAEAISSIDALLENEK